MVDAAHTSPHLLRF